MPELAEVEYFRRVWNPGLDQKVGKVHLHPLKRVFRETDVDLLRKVLPGTTLRSSATHGKRMLFRFSTDIWLGVHLGMTGELRVEPPDFLPQKHDHLVLFQRRSALVFCDPRQFGRVQFHRGIEAPDWWKDLPPEVISPEFTFERMRQFLARHAKVPLKAALLMQEGFPGIGNWMADEILWRARLNPNARSGTISDPQTRKLWEMVRWVAEGAIQYISPAFADPPEGWLFHVRWKAGGLCPRHGIVLERETVGGRTTAWCAKCQPPLEPTVKTRRGSAEE